MSTTFSNKYSFYFYKKYYSKLNIFSLKYEYGHPLAKAYILLNSPFAQTALHIRQLILSYFILVRDTNLSNVKKSFFLKDYNLSSSFYCDFLSKRSTFFKPFRLVSALFPVKFNTKIELLNRFFVKGIPESELTALIKTLNRLRFKEKLGFSKKNIFFDNLIVGNYFRKTDEFYDFLNFYFFKDIYHSDFLNLKKKNLKKINKNWRLKKANFLNTLDFYQMPDIVFDANKPQGLRENYNAKLNIVDLYSYNYGYRHKDIYRRDISLQSSFLRRQILENYCYYGRFNILKQTTWANRDKTSIYLKYDALKIIYNYLRLGNLIKQLNFLTNGDRNFLVNCLQFLESPEFLDSYVHLKTSGYLHDLKLLRSLKNFSISYDYLKKRSTNKNLVERPTYMNNSFIDFGGVNHYSVKYLVRRNNKKKKYFRKARRGLEDYFATNF